ncbi:MAG: HlyD family efflux transporter periplasmic adaptor subunit [Bacteroidia bacterium]|nr:HlyD family efflux transporter periplasmic adaptor subunit [Bacteroidia bacterium]
MPKIPIRTSILLLLLLQLFSCTSNDEKITPTIGNMSESVYASVTILPQDLYDVYTAAPGIIDQILVEEGDSVKLGQVLATVTTNDPKLNIENAELNLELAKQNYKGRATILSSIEKEIQTSKDQYSLDSSNYFRQKKLWQQNVGSEFELKNKKLKYEVSANNLEILKKKLRQTSFELENIYKQAQNSLKKAQSNLNDHIISSRIDGKIYSILKHEGEVIALQEPLAKIGKSNSFIIEMQVDEIDIPKVSIGQVAIISLDAYENKVFEAAITKVLPLKNERTQTFQVEGKFTEVPPVLYAGLSGEANIILSEKKNTMSIPIRFLIDGNKVKTEKGIVNVETGMRNLENVEIISGIDSLTTIIKP